jgi:hypothetical protein
MRTLVALLLAGLASIATAATRLDDSASPRARVDVTSRWLHTREGLDTVELNAMVAEVRNLEVRLNTAAFVGKRGRIYLTVPALVTGLQSASGMRVEWQTRGTLMAGTALPGTRSVVYDGPITKAILADFMDFSLFLDARYLQGGLRFEPVFEIETN